MNDDTWPKKATKHNVDSKQSRGRPCKRLCDVIRENMKSLNLSNKDANNSVEKKYHGKRVDTTCRRPTPPCGSWTINDW